MHDDISISNGTGRLVHNAFVAINQIERCMCLRQVEKGGQGTNFKRWAPISQYSLEILLMNAKRNAPFLYLLFYCYVNHCGKCQLIIQS